MSCGSLLQTARGISFPALAEKAGREPVRPEIGTGPVRFVVGLGESRKSEGETLTC